MTQEIQTLNVGGVNCYLLKTDSGFILIDTGVVNNPKKLDEQLNLAGCKEGDLRLVILTHGDFDHSGNAAYIRDKFHAKIAMHAEDVGKVERGEQDYGNKQKPDRLTLFGRFIIFISSFVVKSANLSPFKPDLIINENFDLRPYGASARILDIPGHTRGSIGVLTDKGELICGDLFMNMLKPDIHFCMDDLVATRNSLAKLKKLRIETIYPGHGKHFPYKEVSRF